MSSKKDKFLESAQKFILKGQLDRAIRDYQQIVAMDPSEIRHRQRLAELLVRVNCKDEAISEYEQIGKYFADNEYFLKAIAVYKQIQKLDPSNLKTAVTLASLNHKQGLTGNALNEYALVVTANEKAGNYAEALKIIEEMEAIDPENSLTRMRKGEVLYRSGAHDGAYGIFSELIASLRQKGDPIALDRVVCRVNELFPGKREVVERPLPQKVVSADPDTAIAEPTLAAVEQQTMPKTPFEGHDGEIDLDVFSESAETLSPAPVAEVVPVIAVETAIAPDLIPASSPVEQADAPVEWEEDIEIGLSLEDETSGLLPMLNDAQDESTPVVDEEAAGTIELDFVAAEGIEFDFSFPSEPSADEDVIPESSAGAALAVTEAAEATALIQKAALPEQIHATEDDAPAYDEFFDQLDALIPDTIEPERVPEEKTYVAFDDEEIFSAIEGGMDEEIDEHDMESHYDLGIAYKEMGLYDEAIKEFKAAARGPRRIDCLTFQALCYQEKGLPEMAEELLKNGLALKDLSQVELLSLKYELAFLYETVGRQEDALCLYGEVCEVNPEFHEVARKINSLKGIDEGQEILDLELEDLDI